MAQKIDEIKTLDLGQRGENAANQVEIDVSEWQAKWPGSEFFIVAMRAEDTVPYVADIRVEGPNIVWILSQQDTAYKGLGYAEVRCVKDEVVKKSKIIKTYTDRSLDDDAEILDPDDITLTYIQQALSAAATIYSSRMSVKRYEEGTGSVWLTGASEQGGYLLDTSLTEGGKAADAHAVGAALDRKANKEDLTDYDPILSWPIGSIYISTDDTSPETLFGGTWERIEDTFLLAAGPVNTVGTVGGEATVTLSETQIPREA